MKLDFSGLKILVIGDPMYDRYVFGHVDRVSPEAPVPVFVPDHYETRHGGAWNVKEQLEALGCTATGGWENLKNWLAFTTKERFMVGSHQLLRVDKDFTVTNTIPSLNGFHAIVISDYAKGACTPEICQEAIASGLPVIVDPKGSDWNKYIGCTVICPNDKELAAIHQEPGAWGGIMIHKRGDKGLRYWPMPVNRGYVNAEYIDFPSVAHHVFDITGAGDTVVAVIAACIAKQIDIQMACKLANIAAGYVVGEVGTTVCPLEYLCTECASL